MRKQPHSPVQVQELRQEWRAILRCSEFAPNFAQWVLEELDWLCMTWPLPTYDEVYMIFQLVQRYTDIALAFDKRVWLDKLKYDRVIDAKHRGYAKAHRRLKPPRMPFQHLQHQATDDAILHHQSDGTLLIYLGNPVQFLPNTDIQVAGHACRVLLSDQHSLLVQPADPEQDWPQEGHVEQSLLTSNPKDIFQHQNFWQQFWWDPSLENMPTDVEAILEPLDQQNFRAWKTYTLTTSGFLPLSG